MPDLPLPLPAESPAHGLLDHLQKSLRPLDHPRSPSMIMDGQAKCVTHDLTDLKLDELEILHLTDLQFGHRAFRLDKAIEYRDWLLKKPNRFCTWGGDMIDAAHCGSPGGPYDNLLRPDGQIFRFCEFAAPMVHRVLGFVGGNHERRGLLAGVDLGLLIASILRLPYSAGIQHLNVRFGTWQERPFRIYLWHGRGAARTMGAIVNMMLSVIGNDEADIYLSGHTHRPALIPGFRNLRRNGKMETEKWYAVSGSSFLDFYSTYAETAGYGVSKLLMPLIYAKGDGTFRVVA